jgi:opacity protein-like surface antigen
MTMLSSARRIIALTAVFLLVSASPAAADSDAVDIIIPVTTGILVGAIGLFFIQDADPAGDYGRHGFYLEAGGMRAYNLFGSGAYNLFDDELVLQALGGAREIRIVENSLGLNGRVGYRIFSWLALEAELEWVNKFAIDVGRGGGHAVQGLGIETLTGTANAKGCFFTGPFQPYALLGVGVMHASAEDSVDGQIGLARSEDWTDLTFRIGGGIDFWANEKFALSLEGTYLKPTGDLKDFDYVSYTVAFQYRF